MAAAKRLIVNADDLGRTTGANRGILEAHRRGIVTSASLMVTRPAAAGAADLAAQAPELGVGLHVTLTGGVPVLRSSEVRSLVDSTGRLPEDVVALSTAAVGEVAAEARAQLKRFRELMRRQPTHIDTHRHAHRLPAVLEAMVTLAWETGLPVRPLSLEMRTRFKREGIPSADRFIDAFSGEGATLERLLRVMASLDLETAELGCHPAIADDAPRAGSADAESGARELDVLTNAEVRHAIQAGGIRLIHYGELGEKD